MFKINPGCLFVLVSICLQIQSKCNSVDAKVTSVKILYFHRLHEHTWLSSFYSTILTCFLFQFSVLRYMWIAQLWIVMSLVQFGPDVKFRTDIHCAPRNKSKDPRHFPQAPSSGCNSYFQLTFTLCLVALCILTQQLRWWSREISMLALVLQWENAHLGHF